MWGWLSKWWLATTPSCVNQSAQNPELDLRFILLIITDCNRSLPIFTEIENWRKPLFSTLNAAQSLRSILKVLDAEPTLVHENLAGFSSLMLQILRSCRPFEHFCFLRWRKIWRRWRRTNSWCSCPEVDWWNASRCRSSFWLHAALLFTLKSVRIVAAVRGDASIQEWLVRVLKDILVVIAPWNYVHLI